MDALRSDMDLDQASDVVAAMTDLAVGRLLVTQYGWTWDRWQTWAVDAIAQLVLDEKAIATRVT